jgi:TM2 domain-containing membrane protein YozV
MKDSRLALLLSLIFPGLGQIYNGQTDKGILFLMTGAVSCIMILLFVVGLVTGSAIWIWGMIDAYKTAEEFNKQTENRK